ncbi:MAG: hypothetical protein L0220_03310 [Acidobacteria bacterium]|nr:hypothetical protein [Acidobacteriota bacterium]
MVDDQITLSAERLRDDLDELRKILRQRYSNGSSQVTGEDVRKQAARLAEIWLVEIANDHSAVSTIGSETVGDLSVHFQRILNFADHATTRSKYDMEIRDILKAFTIEVVLPLKQARGKSISNPTEKRQESLAVTTVFIGQSFAKEDQRVNQCVSTILKLIGVKVVTGERPKADSISEKVKRLIDEQQVFVGIFTCRDKVARKSEWTTSSWVIDEKAYALGRQKSLILLKEKGVGSIGGIQGDYEYLEFSRNELELLVIQLLQLFELRNNGLRK